MNNKNAQVKKNRFNYGYKYIKLLIYFSCLLIVLLISKDNYSYRNYLVEYRMELKSFMTNLEESQVSKNINFKDLYFQHDILGRNFETLYRYAPKRKVDELYIIEMNYHDLKKVINYIEQNNNSSLANLEIELIIGNAKRKFIEN